MARAKITLYSKMLLSHLCALFVSFLPLRSEADPSHLGSRKKQPLLTLANLMFSKGTAGRKRRPWQRRKGWDSGVQLCATSTPTPPGRPWKPRGLGARLRGRVQRGAEPHNPWIRLTPRGCAAIRSPSSGHTKGAARASSWSLENLPGALSDAAATKPKH